MVEAASCFRVRASRITATQPISSNVPEISPSVANAIAPDAT
jgi:hypothetical protein